MKKLLNTALIGIFASGLLACAAEPPKETLEAMAPTTINVDGTEYQVKRSLHTTVEGETSEGWSVVYEGLAVSCPEPTELSCTNALKDFRGG